MYESVCVCERESVCESESECERVGVGVFILFSLLLHVGMSRYISTCCYVSVVNMS